MLNIMLDTDIGNDCDDAAAAALACIYESAGLCRLLDFTVNTADPYAPGCLEAIENRYGGHREIGVYKGEGFPANPSSYCRAVAERFGSTAKKRPEAVSLMRRKLVGCARKSVKIICIGQLNNLRALLQSAEDEIGTDGLSLVREKVSEVVIMGGMFNAECVEFLGKPYMTEYNISVSVPDSIKAIELCPVPVVFSDFILGKDVMTLGSLIDRETTDPVGYAYKLFCGGNRPSWDILTVMYAVEGERGLFRKSSRGTVTVEDNGRTRFSENENGRHCYLLPAVENSRIEKAIEDIFHNFFLHREELRVNCTINLSR